MTQDEIIRSPIGREQLVALAREAGLIQYVQVEKTCVSNSLKRFAALVAEHERNRLAWTQEHWTQYEHAIAAPVRTKDLTDDEIANTLEKTLVVEDERFEFQGGRILTIRESELLPIARAVIAADREKNK